MFYHPVLDTIPGYLSPTLYCLTLGHSRETMKAKKLNMNIRDDAAMALIHYYSHRFKCRVNDNELLNCKKLFTRHVVIIVHKNDMLRFNFKF